MITRSTLSFSSAITHKLWRSSLAVSYAPGPFRSKVPLDKIIKPFNIKELGPDVQTNGTNAVKGQLIHSKSVLGIYIYIYITNCRQYCRQYCFGLLGLIIYIYKYNI